MTAGTDYSVRRTENRHVLPSYLQGWGILQEKFGLRTEHIISKDIFC